jgi:phytoene dehydrogenase-like protein
MADVIVIGGGVDELVAAHSVARAGRRVVVLDPSSGDASPQTGWVPEDIVKALGVRIDVQWPDPWAEAPLDGGGRLQLWHDMAKSVESIRKLSARDASRWPDFCERMARLARLLERLYTAPPPDPLSERWPDRVQLLSLGWRTRRLGRQGIEDLMRMLPMPAADLLDDWFESDALKGLLAAGAVMDLCHGPRSGGTALPLLHRHAGCPLGVFRPPITNARALLQSLPGIELRRGVSVGRIEVKAGSATGVVLAGGEELSADMVVSGLDPKQTLLEKTDTAWLDPDLVSALRHIRARGVAAHLTIELDRAPEFSNLVIAPSLDYVEKAYDHAKYRRASDQPVIEARADGKTVHARIQYVPHCVEFDAARPLQMLRPHVSSVVSHRELERSALGPEGQPHHAELTLDQFLWMRPLPELARYATPIGGLYLCGPAMHPGGGIAGAAGWNCAQRILQ